MDVNYFDGLHMATNTISHQQKVDSVELKADEIPELIDQDTGKKGETNIEHYILSGDMQCMCCYGLSLKYASSTCNISYICSKVFSLDSGGK